MSSTAILAEMKSDSLQYLAVLSLNRISISAEITDKTAILLNSKHFTCELVHSVCQEINEVMKRISCKPKALPHYFGRGIHAIDVLDYAKNEGTLQVISMSTHF